MSSSSNSNPVLALTFQSNPTENIWFQVAWTILRVFAGLLMIHNGLDKLADVNGFAENVIPVIGLPFPVFFTYCAAYTELIGAILIILGLLTRPAAFSLLITMFVAIYFHLKADGFDIFPLETAALYALCYLFLLINGAGSFSLDTLLLKSISGKDA